MGKLYIQDDVFVKFSFPLLAAVLVLDSSIHYTQNMVAKYSLPLGPLTLQQNKFHQLLPCILINMQGHNATSNKAALERSRCLATETNSEY